jgi:hypothetical protein
VVGLGDQITGRSGLDRLAEEHPERFREGNLPLVPALGVEVSPCDGESLMMRRLPTRSTSSQQSALTSPGRSTA